MRAFCAARMMLVERIFVLAHAPLVGPSTWRWIASALPGEVRVPDLHPGGDAITFDSCIGRIADQIPAGSDVVLVGHSGAGILLPCAAARAAPARVTFVFVDAGLPPMSGSTLDEHPVMKDAGIEWSGRPSFADRIESDGHLPPWHTWWGDAGMEWLVPDRDRRSTVSADIPRLPLSFYDDGCDVPPGWSDEPAGYVLLSDTYRIWAEAARSYGWPVVEVPGTHLEIVNRPDDVASAILEVANAAQQA